MILRVSHGHCDFPPKLALFPVCVCLSWCAFVVGFKC